MIINDIQINAELDEVLSELQHQLQINNIPYLSKYKDSGNDIMVQCPYHGNGQERRPSAGIRKSDGMFHCFHGDTKVITREYGAVQMRSIVHKKVHILNGNGEWEEVTFNHYGKQSLMKLTLSCNTKKKVIYATPEHEWIVNTYHTKKQTQQLRAGMYLSKCIPKLQNIELDIDGIIHGYCYGDGNTHGHNKNYTRYYNKCFFYNKSDLELKQYFSNGTFNKGKAGNGVEYEYVEFSSNRNLKEVPDLSESESYLFGFLAGYFVADGNCFNNKITIYSHRYEDLYKVQQICTKLGIMSTEIGASNIKAGKRGCLTVKQDTHGYTLRLVRNTISDNFFITDKGRNSHQRYNSRSCYKVVSVEQTNLIDDVYCCQTSTHSFALEHFILTGNCFACNETHTLPEVISYVFGHTDDMFGKFGLKWLVKNFATVQIEERKDIEIDMERNHITNKDSLLVNSDTNKSNSFISEEELNTYRYYHPYWTERGITDDNIIELFDLGYDKKTNEIIMPNYNKDGKCVFVARRSVIGKRFSYPKNAEKIVYGIYQLYQLEKFPKEVYITESMIDCILLWQAGYYALALNGTGSELQFKQLRDIPCRHLILATDNDKAGQQAREKIKKNIKNKLITEIEFPSDIKDIGDLGKARRFEDIKNIKRWEVF